MLEQALFTEWLKRYSGVDFVRTSPCYCPLASYVRATYPQGGVGMSVWWEAAEKQSHDLPPWAQALRLAVDTGGRSETGGRRLAISRNEVLALLK